MKLYVGTLFSGESEFDQCKKAIKNQTYKNFDHFVFSYLPNKEAHMKLYMDFLNKPEYDILVKIDADTVLTNKRIFEKIVSIFKNNNCLKHLNFMLWDFYTKQKIRGQSSNRNGFSILRKDDNVFVDRIIKYRSEEEFYSKRVIGDHSPDPSLYQAFHFGFHRQLKKQHYMIFHLFKAFISSFNVKRAYALCGAMAVITDHLSSEHNDMYNDDRIQHFFKKTPNRPLVILYPYITFFFTYYFIKLGMLKAIGKIKNVLA